MILVALLVWYFFWKMGCPNHHFSISQAFSSRSGFALIPCHPCIFRVFTWFNCNIFYYTSIFLIQFQIIPDSKITSFCFPCLIYLKRNISFTTCLYSSVKGAWSLQKSRYTEQKLLPILVKTELQKTWDEI